MENICNLCEGAFNFHEGWKGKNYDKLKLMFVANKPDERVLIPVLPGFDSYYIALSNTKTGKNMKSLLNYCGLNWEDIFWTNLFKCVLPNNRIPSKREYVNCLTNHLNKQIEFLNPNLIVALGSQVFSILFPSISKYSNLISHKEFIGDITFYKDKRVLIYPHPQKIRPPYCNKQREKELFEVMRCEISKLLT